jgi:beta-phosphoglucomutase-like phosphatase (HAD superfamily)
VSGSCVVFDLDGVLVDSEPLWVRARQDLVRAAGGRWLAEAETAMMGISSDSWSAYMRDRLGLGQLAPERIRAEVIARMIALYRERALLPGARAAVEATAARWPLAVASGSDRDLLDAVLASSGLTGYFAATWRPAASGSGSPVRCCIRCQGSRCPEQACAASRPSVARRRRSCSSSGPPPSGPASD